MYDRLDPMQLREEYEDGVEYNKSADGRRLIEEKRVMLLGSTSRGYAATSAPSPVSRTLHCPFILSARNSVSTQPL